MVDINEIRKMFAEHMAENHRQRFSFDAALFHVAKEIYNKGLEDGLKLGSKDDQV